MFACHPYLTNCQYLFINISLDNVDHWFFLFCFLRPEFIEFFGLHATTSNGSPILTASASPLNNDNDDAAKANDDDTENPPTAVI